MKPNPHLNAAIMEVVDHQLRDLDPPATKQTYDRLLAEGFSDEETRKMIARVLVYEMHNMLKNNRTFDHGRFDAALAKLPNESE